MFENPASDFERYVNGVPPRPDHREHRNRSILPRPEPQAARISTAAPGCGRTGPRGSHSGPGPGGRQAAGRSMCPAR
jgi:hypothetical protein